MEAEVGTDFSYTHQTTLVWYVLSGWAVNVLV